MLDSERQMVLSAPARFGAYYQHAFECSIYLGHFLKSIDRSRWIFASFLAQVKKHHTLALLSTVRLHQIQSTMDLRQVLEAGALAAFAIANPEHHHFVVQDEHGYVNHSKKLTRRAYDWLGENYQAGSRGIKEIKDHINSSSAHANLLTTINNA